MSDFTWTDYLIQTLVNNGFSIHKTNAMSKTVIYSGPHAKQPIVITINNRGNERHRNETIYNIKHQLRRCGADSVLFNAVNSIPLGYLDHARNYTISELEDELKSLLVDQHSIDVAEVATALVNAAKQDSEPYTCSAIATAQASVHAEHERNNMIANINDLFFDILNKSIQCHINDFGSVTVDTSRRQTLITKLDQEIAETHGLQLKCAYQLSASKFEIIVDLTSNIQNCFVSELIPQTAIVSADHEYGDEIVIYSDTESFYSCDIPLLSNYSRDELAITYDKLKQHHVFITLSA